MLLMSSEYIMCTLHVCNLFKWPGWPFYFEISYFKLKVPFDVVMDKYISKIQLINNNNNNKKFITSV